MVWAISGICETLCRSLTRHARVDLRVSLSPGREVQMKHQSTSTRLIPSTLAQPVADDRLVICGLWNRSSVAKLCIPDFLTGQGIEVKIRLSPVYRMLGLLGMQSRLGCGCLSSCKPCWTCVSRVLGWIWLWRTEPGLPCRPKSAHIANIVLLSWSREIRPSRSDIARVAGQAWTVRGFG